mmetsp:Transcript_16819/g.39002  ORF Transcript_16819/g.39002 Transcript_16819/m.39002 type:complete len:693 (-) Transcript_16819:15-2093(-)
MQGILGIPLVSLQLCLWAAIAQVSNDSPVGRVLTLLSELQIRAQQDLQNDQQVYNRFACACEEATGKQASELTEGRSTLQNLGRTILELRGSVETLVHEAQVLKQHIADNEQAQATATQIRQKENGAFMAEKAEMQQALAALEKAMHVLQAAAPQLVQRQARTLRRSTAALSASSWPKVLAEAQDAALKASQRCQVPLDVRRLSALAAVQEKEAYAPQSLTVQGILSDMYHTFASSLESRTSDEAKAQKAFEEFIEVKKQALKTFQESLKKKEASKVEAEFMLADATRDYQRVEAEIKANEALFDATKGTCAARTQEWSTRKQQHDDLLAAINEATAILSSADSRDAFGKAFSTSLLQVTSNPQHHSVSAARAASVLRSHARRSQSLRLANVAAMLQQAGLAVGHFDEVISAIATIIGTLKQEQIDDDQAKDDCTRHMSESRRAIEHYDWKVTTGNAELQKLAKVLQEKSLDKQEIETHLATLNQTRKSMEAARIAENAAFLQEKADDSKAIELLAAARDALARYFEDRGTTLRMSFVDKAAQPLPEANFTKSTDRKLQSQGVVSLMAVIIEDLRSEINANIAAEHAAQLDYEKQVATAQLLQESLLANHADLEETIASVDKESGAVSTAVQEDSQELGHWQKTKEDAQPHCEWVLGNVEDRRRKREIEMEGLVQAKEYLAGAQPVQAFLSS